METDSHVLWDCPNTLLARPRKQVVKRVWAAWRKQGLSLGDTKIAGHIWHLDRNGVAVVRGLTDLGLQPDVPENAELQERRNLLLQAIAPHTSDLSGLNLDRAGMFGPGWAALLCRMGMTREAALVALV